MLNSLPILVSPAPSLREVSRELSFEKESEQIRQWATLLSDTLQQHDSGVGLAAPQVGLNVRMIAIECSGRQDPVQVWVNPVIKRRIGDRVSREGCLSIPGKTFDCQRAKRIEIIAHTPQGVRHCWRCEGLEAVCLQHEIDHLDGVLIEDQGRDLSR